MRLKWGAHAPSRAVVGAPADHINAPQRISVSCLSCAVLPTGEAPVGTREGACAPRFELHGLVLAAAVALSGSGRVALADDEPKPPSVGVASNIRVLTSNEPDVSSLEAWKKSVIKHGMSDKEKALAIFNSAVAFQHHDFPPFECLQREDWVLDPIKMFNVYGYSMCSVSAANMACLARYAGLPARVFTIRDHLVPEFYYDGAWHLLDADMIHYFPKADGSLASLQEVVDGITEWQKAHPEFPMFDKAARHQWMKEMGWKAAGPEILSRNPFFNADGSLPSGRFTWADSIMHFSKINHSREPCYCMGSLITTDWTGRRWPRSRPEASRRST